MPWRRLGGGDELWLLIHNLCTRWGEWSASRPGRTLLPRKGPPVPIVYEAGWAPEPVWTQRIQEKSFRLCRGSNLDRLVVQPVARHYTDWAWVAQMLNKFLSFMELKSYITVFAKARHRPRSWATWLAELVLFTVIFGWEDKWETD
jgi:hypothetical protein